MALTTHVVTEFISLLALEAHFSTVPTINENPFPARFGRRLSVQDDK